MHWEFVGRSQEWLEKRYAELQEELVSDKTLTGWTGSDVSATKQKGNHSVLLRMKRVYDALSELDPVKYPVASSPSSRTTAVFRD